MPATTPKAHPRVCGENVGILASYHRPLWLIPAYAGKTSATVAISPSDAGSSPRMRGKPQPAVNQRWRGGLIPAYAGKTWPRTGRPRGVSAHPRVCGENSFVSARNSASRGSSPRMRGKPQKVHQSNRYLRLIPAYAGKTVDSRARRPACRAHPRVCGENCCEPPPEAATAGSSPRMRGKR